MSSAGTGGGARAGGGGIPPGGHAPGTAHTANPALAEVATLADWFGHPNDNVFDGMALMSLSTNLTTCNPAVTMHLAGNDLDDFTNRVTPFLMVVQDSVSPGTKKQCFDALTLVSHTSCRNSLLDSKSVMQRCCPSLAPTQLSRHHSGQSRNNTWMHSQLSTSLP